MLDIDRVESRETQIFVDCREYGIDADKFARKSRLGRALGFTGTLLKVQVTMA